MYGWLHKGFPEYHDVQLKRDREGKTFLVILEIHKDISSFRTANHFTSHALKINKIKKLMKGGWGTSSIHLEPTIILILIFLLRNTVILLQDQNRNQRIDRVPHELILSECDKIEQFVKLYFILMTPL